MCLAHGTAKPLAVAAAREWQQSLFRRSLLLAAPTVDAWACYSNVFLQKTAVLQLIVSVACTLVEFAALGEPRVLYLQGKPCQLPSTAQTENIQHDWIVSTTFPGRWFRAARHSCFLGRSVSEANSLLSLISPIPSAGHCVYNPLSIEFLKTKEQASKPTIIKTIWSQ